MIKLHNLTRKTKTSHFINVLNWLFCQHKIDYSVVAVLVLRYGGGGKEVGRVISY